MHGPMPLQCVSDAVQATAKVVGLGRIGGGHARHRAAQSSAQRARVNARKRRHGNSHAAQQMGLFVIVQGIHCSSLTGLLKP